MTLNTFVAGNTSSVRVLCGALRNLGTGVEDTATGLHKARSDSEADWEGQAGDAFRAQADQQARDADRLAQLYGDLGTALTSFADDLDTVNARMQQARQVATAAQLLVFGQMIFPPVDVPAPTVNPSLPGKPPAPDPAAAALHAQQQAAYSEAEATVNQTRDLERQAHQKLQDALQANSFGLDHIGQHDAWMQAAAAPTTPAAARLANAATSMDNWAANATHSMFEQALVAGPVQTRAMWDSLTPDQQTDLEDRYPGMIGNANGLPAMVRNQVNKRLLAQQQQVIAGKLQDAKQALAEFEATTPRDERGYAEQKAQLEARFNQLQKTQDGLTSIDNYLRESGSDRYLLAINATADNDRGQAIIASGNPDTATNVLTTVPGTFNDIHDVVDYAHGGDQLVAEAKNYAPKGATFSSITYTGYDSPPTLANAAEGRYAENAKDNLAQFQEGLRVSHQGPPSTNTILGHSYGSTVAGEAARDHNGMGVNNFVFIGSPGVGVDHANQLGVPPDHVWSGTATLDPIQYLAPSVNPLDYGPPGDPKQLVDPEPLRFGANPSDPRFGGQILPTNPWSSHSDYWNEPQSSQGMARIIAGNPGGQPHQ